ncbi:MAG TPA: FecR domain-containing protein [Sphingobium sp.]|nr:FecR domain-containing protein [Sphingobium sp.]
MRIVEDMGAPDRNEEAALWCLELSEGNLPPERRLELDRWMKDPENHEAFQRAAEVWDVTEAIAGTPEVVRMRSEGLERYRAASARRWKKPQSFGWRRWGMLASALAAALVMAVWLALPAMKAYQTGIGETRVAMLQDGSRLSLDADTQVNVSFDSKRRMLVLDRGRAKFDVAHNPLKPFTVVVGDKMVVATGTSFSVEKVGGEAHIVLYEGRVAVLDKDGQSITGSRQGTAMDELLKPGSELVLPAQGPGAASVDPVDLKTSWREGQLSFEDEPLSLAVERMNRYLSRPLVVADAEAARVKVTGLFDDRDSRGFLEAMRQLNGVQAEQRDGKVLLTRP